MHQVGQRIGARLGARRRGRIGLVALLAALLGLGLLPTAVSAASTTVTFSYTGGVQTWTVPPGVTSATFTVAGAQGGTILGPGPLGGTATATLAVSPGTTIWLVVGGQGGNRQGCTSGGAGGFNGGGAGGGGACGGAGGGGASDVRIGANDLAHRVLVAGGGGGSANSFSNCAATGGGGGGLTGGNGQDASCAAGGTGGNQDGTSGSGQPGVGSAGATGSGFSVGGGGGGGGYYGGAGGGQNLGGGGGSGYGPGGTVFQTGVWEGAGQIVISYLDRSAQLTNVRGDGRYRGSVTYSATLTTAGGTPIVGQVVAFTLRGIALCNPAGGFNPCPRTDANGVATLIVRMNLTGPGTYPNLVGASFAGSAESNPASGTGPLVVTP